MDIIGRRTHAICLSLVLLLPVVATGCLGASETTANHSAQDAGVPLVGPNCVGIINTDASVRMHGMFAERPMPRQGRVAFVSQSGALCLSILDAARSRGIGFSKFISIGNKADVNELDLLEYLGSDPETGVILMYIEELSYGRRFIEVARNITLDRRKPIFALKSGRSPQGAKAARSHRGRDLRPIRRAGSAQGCLRGVRSPSLTCSVGNCRASMTRWESDPGLPGQLPAVWVALSGARRLGWVRYRHDCRPAVACPNGAR